MAMCLRFTCDNCGFYQEGWDEGNPYIEFPNGKRNYYYHPSNEILVGDLRLNIDNPETSDNELKELIENGVKGNASDYICRDCERVSKIDSDRDEVQCSRCKSRAVEEIFELAGKKCVRCDGNFSMGEFTAIS